MQVPLIDPLGNLQYSVKNEYNQEFINHKLTSFESRYDIKCEWIEDMLGDTSGIYSFLYDDQHLYAAISNDDPYMINDIPFYYSNNSCTFDRLMIEGRPELSSGRVLRAFKLTQIFNIVQRPFIYCGLVIPTALEYNKAMGLMLFKDLGIPITTELIDYFKYVLHDPSFSEERLTFDPHYSNMLFFPMNPAVLQGKHITPHNIIQYMLPKSKKIGGKRSKGKNKRKTKRKK
jgi:hypothetical protein